MSERILPQQTWDDVIERQARIAAQHAAYDLFFWLYRSRPDLVAEELRNRARLQKAAPVLDTKVLVRAVMGGAISPAEAVELWHRIKG